MKRSKKLRTSLILLLVATTLSTALLLGIGTLLYGLPKISSISRETAQLESIHIADLLEYNLRGLEARISPTVAFLQTRPSPTELQFHLDAIVGNGEVIAAVYVLTADGSVEAVGLPPARQGRRADLRIGDFSSNHLFKTVQESGSTSWSDKYLSAMTGSLAVGVAVPAEGRIVIGEISPRAIMSTVRAISRRTEHFVLVVDSRGEWIADNVASPENRLQNWAEHPAVKAALEKRPVLETTEFQGATFHSGHAMSPHLGWTFVVGVAAGMHNPIVRTTVFLVIGGFFAALIIGTLLAPLWTAQMERPLRRLISRVHRLAEGDYSEQQLRDTRIAEFDELFADMDRMAAAIQERQSQIQQTAKRLENNERELEMIFNASPAAMSVSDMRRNNEIITVNEAWEKQFGRQRGVVAGFNGAQIGLWASIQDRHEFLRRLEASGSVTGMEIEMLHSDGRALLCRVSGRIVDSKEQRFLIMVQEDISEHRRIEAEIRNLNAELEVRVQRRTEDLALSNEELEQALKHLQTAQKELVHSENLAALGRLVAGVAHELNTPIGNGLMAATTFRDQLKEFRESLSGGLKRQGFEAFLENADTAGDIMVRNLERGASLINSFKRLAVDQTSAQRRRFGLAETVNETLSILRPSIKRTPYRIETSIPAGIEFDSYPGPLEQVLTNLINNAILHGFEGRDHGLITLSAESIDDQHVRLRFADDGQGIPLSLQTHIFEPFFTTKLGRGGSGLGLHIARNAVVNVLGGNIFFTSAEGQGASFEITLPRIAPSKETAPAVEMTSARTIVGK